MSYQELCYHWLIFFKKCICIFVLLVDSAQTWFWITKSFRRNENNLLTLHTICCQRVDFIIGLGTFRGKGVSSRPFQYLVWRVTVWQFDSVTVWQCDSLTVWSCDSMTVLQCDSMTVWQCYSVTVWQCDSVTVWQYDSMTVWQCDSMTVWQCDSVTVWQYDSMTVWQYDSVTVWRVTLWQCQYNHNQDMILMRLQNVPIYTCRCDVFHSTVFFWQRNKNVTIKRL